MNHSLVHFWFVWENKWISGKLLTNDMFSNSRFWTDEGPFRYRVHQNEGRRKSTYFMIYSKITPYTQLFKPFQNLHRWISIRKRKSTCWFFYFCFKYQSLKLKKRKKKKKEEKEKEKKISTLEREDLHLPQNKLHY